ncbi:MAG: CPBP family glutamic-type intramembrane protease [Acidimicrobiales bacterium]
MGATSQPPGPGGNANPGWYIDPWARSAWRWWDGWRWTGWVSPPEDAPHQALVDVLAPPRPHQPMSAAPPEAPQRERLSDAGSPGTAWPPPAQPQSPAQPRSPYPGAIPFPESALRPAPNPPASSTRSQAPAPAAPLPERQRRRALIELLLVLAVFPAPYVLTALIDLFSAVAGDGAGQRTPVVIPGNPGASFLLELIAIALPLAAGALVAYMLTNSGPFGPDPSPKDAPRSEGGLRAIGLDRLNVRGDLALVLGFFLACFLIPIAGGSLLLHWAGIRTVTPSTGGAPSYYYLLNVANGVTSGVVEEIVVLGFLVRRLEQLNVPLPALIAIAVAVRGSYHLYYGWGVLPILLWALVTVLLYRRYRRI